MKPSVTLSKTTIAWTERGQGAPVLLLHPLFFGGSFFDSVAGRISQHGHRVVAVDLPGHGESVMREGGVDAATAADAIGEFIAARSLERCHVIGVAFGAEVALRLAIQSPELVRSLVLMAASVGPEAGRSLRLFRTTALLARVFGSGVAARRLARVFVGRTAAEGPRGPMLTSMIESALRAIPRRTMLALLGSSLDRTPISVEERRSIDCPVLAVIGGEDRIRTQREARETVAPIESHAVVELPDCGHLAVLEQPAKVVSLILRFLEAGTHRA